MKKLLLALAIAVTIVVLLLYPTPIGAQSIPPPAKRAARVQITEGPSLESFGYHNQAIICWTSNNPGGSDEHYGVVYYGIDPNHLIQKAKGHIRLNRTHSYTVFRVRVQGLQPGTTYYYRVSSMNADGMEDGVNSGIYHFTAPGGA
jgi:phosphodiesterase/alkaline phosphatase D-like protein